MWCSIPRRIMPKKGVKKHFNRMLEWDRTGLYWFAIDQIIESTWTSAKKLFCFSNWNDLFTPSLITFSALKNHRKMTPGVVPREPCFVSVLCEVFPSCLKVAENLMLSGHSTCRTVNLQRVSAVQLNCGVILFKRLHIRCICYGQVRICR